MSELATIDLEKLPLKTLAKMANEAAEQSEKSARKTVENAINCGRYLLAAKARVPHGEWMAWCGTHFDHSQNRATQFIQLASNFTRGLNLLEATSIREALRMIAETPEAQAKAADRAQRKLDAAPVSQPCAPRDSATPAQRKLDAPQGQPPGTMHGESYHMRPLPGSDEAPATTPVAMPQTVWQPEQSQEQERITTTVPTPREHESRAMAASVTPTDRPGEWYDHWYYHVPTGGLEKLSHKDILTAAEHIGEPKPIVERTLEIFGAVDVIRVMVATAGAGKPALDLARQLQQAAAALLASEGKAPPKATVPTVEALIAHLDDYADAQIWSTPLSDAADDWARYKQALAPADRIRTLDSWAATLKRMAKLAGTHGEVFVADMVEKSIANGWTGWEHVDAVKRSPAAVKSGRKTNDDWGIQYETVEG